MKPLIPRLKAMGSNHLTDELIAMAHNVEQALLQCGAKPGKDYVLMDLFRLAHPFAVELFKVRSGMEYDYPAEMVIQG